MSDNWVVQNLENALNTWNEKLAEIWQLVTQSPEQFKGGTIWNVIVNIHGALQATRPVLIISNDIGNRHSPTVIVAAITSRVHTKAKLPTHTAIRDFEGLNKDSIILLEQIRTIDKKRLQEYIGMLSESEMARVDKALAISVSLNILKGTN